MKAILWFIYKIVFVQVFRVMFSQYLTDNYRPTALSPVFCKWNERGRNVNEPVQAN